MAVPDSISLAALAIERARLTDVVLAKNTQRGYAYDWRAFCAWAKNVGRQSLPAIPDTVTLHLTALLLRGLKVSSCARRAAAIAHVHRGNNLESPVTPEVRLLLRAARRARRDSVRRVMPLSVADLRAIARVLGAENTPIAIRDRAILVTAFASALRSASIVALMLADVEFAAEGVILTAWHEKTNPFSRRLIGLPHGKHSETCPVNCLREWIARRGSFAGPLFTRFDRPQGRSCPLQPERICQIVQQAVARIGLDWKLYGGHSPRRSLITEAVRSGVNELAIMGQSGHRDRRSLAAYFERDVWRANVCSALDL